MKLKESRSISGTREEGGQIILAFVALLSLFFLLFALIVDIGGATMKYKEAQGAVHAAAYAASHGVDLNKFYDRNELELEAARASAMAGQYASVNSGGSVRIVNIYVAEDQVWVTGTTSYKTRFLHFIGIPAYNIVVTASSEPAYGITEKDQ
jgi:Flp pilus assembly protein TadG